MIYIIRHGQTALNNARALQGRSNHPINEAGEQQARELGEWFRTQGIRFDVVFSSPLQRAVQTAKLAAGEMPIRVDERLIEMDYGPYEGMDLRNPAPEVMAFFRDFVHAPAPEGMEPLHEVVERTGRFMETLRGENEKNILISTHAIAMKGILEYLTPDSRGSYWSKYIGNCAVYVTSLQEDGFAVPKELVR